MTQNLKTFQRKKYVNNFMKNKDYIKTGDFYCDGEEWIYFGASIDEFDFDEDDDE